MSDNHNSGSFLNGAFFGFLVGAVVGVLFAPGPGDETRKKLKEAHDEYSEKGKKLIASTKETMEEVRLAAEPLVREIEEKVIPVLERVQEAEESVKEEVLEKIDQIALETDESRKAVANLKKRFFKNVRKS